MKKIFFVYFFAIATAPEVSGKSDFLYFDPDFLKLSDGEKSSNIDLSFFSRSGGIQPGTYELDIYVNGKFVRRSVVVFSQQSKEKNGKVTPSFIDSDYHLLGIKSDYFSEALERNSLNGKLDLNRMVYDITVPQNSLLYSDFYLSPPSSWDNGIPALLMQYGYSASRIRSRGVNNDSNFFRLGSNFTAEGWILRNDSSWTESNGRSEFNSLRTYLQKSYAALQGGSFSLGQLYTDGEFFDSFPFTGIQAQSDDGMLKSYFSQYAPVIRGIATSQSRVTVRQGGIVLYQENVPPGEFSLRDVTMLSGGDLEVEVRGEDGSVRTFTQTAGSLPVLQREGRVRYSLSAGRYRDSNESLIVREPDFIQGVTAVGLPFDFTAYGGILYSDIYLASMLGMGRYIPLLGAFSGDITYSNANTEQRAERGNSIRFSFAKEFDSTGTSLSIASYRYSTEGFSTFSDTVMLNERKLRSRIQASAIQPLLHLGQLSLSGSKDDYWNGDSGNSFMGSYSLPTKYASFNVSAGIRRSSDTSEKDHVVMLGVNIPLSRMKWSDNMVLNTTTRFNKNNSETFTGVSGRMNDLSYSVTKSFESQGKAAGLNLSYNSNFASLNGGYTEGKNSNSLHYGVHGGIAIHPYGATLAREISFTSGNALVITPEISSVGIRNGDVKTDYFGNAVVSHLTSYQRNHLAVDIDSFGDDVDMSETNKTIIPKRGVLVPVKFDASVGYRAIFKMRNKEYSFPLGTRVSIITNGGAITGGYLDENSEVYLNGLTVKGMIKLTSSHEGHQVTCEADYDLSGYDKNLVIKELLCR